MSTLQINLSEELDRFVAAKVKTAVAPMPAKMRRGTSSQKFLYISMSWLEHFLK